MYFGHLYKMWLIVSRGVDPSLSVSSLSSQNSHFGVKEWAGPSPFLHTPGVKFPKCACAKMCKNGQKLFFLFSVMGRILKVLMGVPLASLYMHPEEGMHPLTSDNLNIQSIFL